MIVADGNLIIYRHVGGTMSSLADAAVVKDADWRTVPLWRFEMTSAVVKMIRVGVLAEAAGRAAMAAAARELLRREVDVPQERALQVALRHGISAYDAQYIALAEIAGVPCVTADAALAKKAPALSILLSEFVK